MGAAALLAGACTSGDEPTSDGAGTDEPAGAAADDTRAPGVTDDTIRLGITYVDLDAIREVVDLDQGDYEATYQALIDDINDAGGIHGRTIEPVFAAVNPIGTAPAEEACLRLTEDDDVFAAIGFFQDDQVLCYLEGHETAVLGGVATQARTERANAPWYSTEGSAESDAKAIAAMADAGELDGRVGVFGSVLSETQTNDVVLPQLEELGIEPVDTAILDAPQDDVTAQNQATSVIAERFRSEDIDTVLVVGSAALPIANGLAPLDYRPRLLFTSRIAVNAYTSGIAPDLSMFDGAVLGAVDNEVFDEPAMEECLATLEEAGISGITDPREAAPGDPLPFVAASAACRNVTLFAAIAEAAGPDLTYGTFHQGAESLDALHLPGSVDDYDYSAGLDGDLPLYLFDWDPADEQFVGRDTGGGG
jgi:hypothetical protein